MSIRREDKELIHNLAVLGALLGVCLGVLAVMHQSKKAQDRNRQLSEYRQTHAALAELAAPKGVPGEVVVDENIIKQMQQQMQEEQPALSDTKVSFWLRLPRWGFWGICAGMGIVGAITGFSTIWVTGWIGSVLIYYFIRGLYKLIRKVAPNSTAAKSLAQSQQQQEQSANQMMSYRDDSRILPMLIKLMFLLFLVLCVLAAVVWYLAGI